MARVIALTSLLLIAAATFSPSPTSNPKKTEKVTTAPERGGGKRTPVEAPPQKASPVPTASHTPNYTYNYYYPVSQGRLPLPLWFQAITTVVLVIFTGGLFLTSYWQWQTLTRQAANLEATLALAYRPKLRVRRVRFQEPPKPGEVLRVQFEIVNLGGTPARITKSNCTLAGKLASDLIEAPHCEERGDDVIAPHLILRGGETLVAPVKGEEPLDSADWIYFHDRNWQVYVIGFVDYADRLDLVRRTAFYRRCPFMGARFTAVQDPDYDYED